ncbi:hypothetical protein [Rhizobium rhizophilum]|uniref:Uncharacterized protein n=1 Tax=Rhizobium rhizophilum TaxID=1850373 RepID=A0ABY2QTS1_9HYPH|nr:hypothetical protein [Rhizobium rhizophilum]THV13763.1 hypothetical protein E9677_12710 [Rhizobium rhizophilum]
MTDNRKTRTYGEPMPLHSQRATYDGFRSVRLLNDDIGLATTTYSYKLSYDEVEEAAERIALMWNLHLGESVEELRHRYLDTPSPQPNVATLEKALKDARALLSADYGTDGRVVGVSHEMDGLRRMVGILDAALATTEGKDNG